MFIKCINGEDVKQLSRGSRKKVLIKCDWESCEKTWVAEYRKWYGKEKHFCASHRQVGKKHTIETRLKLSLMNLGKKNPAYKTGNWSSVEAGRKNVYYDLWREGIRKAAHGVCQECRERLGTETHHSEISYIDIVKRVKSQFTMEELDKIDEGVIGFIVGLYHITHNVPGIWVCNECHRKLSSNNNKPDEEESDPFDNRDDAA